MLFQRRNHFTFIAALWLLAVVLALPGALVGQQVYGSIYGSVVDKSGAGVPNASISITELTKNIQAKTETNESGNYRLGQLIPGAAAVFGFGADRWVAVTSGRVRATLPAHAPSLRGTRSARAPTADAARAARSPRVSSSAASSWPSSSSLNSRGAGMNAHAYSCHVMGSDTVMRVSPVVPSHVCGAA